MRRLRRLLHDEQGLETVEYAVIAALVVSGVVAVIIALGKWTKGSLARLGRMLYQT
ncbi:MAG TPA: Flp family type IVb pilin [Planctomycetota bacterium]|nr:Flp family type IVb pilin [Planctomycetota bacterium]